MIRKSAAFSVLISTLSSAYAEGLIPAAPAAAGICYLSGSSGETVPCVQQDQIWRQVLRPRDPADTMTVDRFPIGSILGTNPAAAMPREWPAQVKADLPSGGPGDQGKLSFAHPDYSSIGTGYRVGDIVELAGGTGSSAKLRIENVGINTINLTSGGSGWRVDDLFYFDASVTGGEVLIFASGKVTAVDNGAVTAFIIYDPGTYTSKGQIKTTFNGVAYSGSGRGLTFESPAWGATWLYASDSGDYTILPAGDGVPVATTGGSGTGLKVIPGWRSQSIRRTLWYPTPIVDRTTYGRVPAIGYELRHPTSEALLYKTFCNRGDEKLPGTDITIGNDCSVEHYASNYNILNNNATRLPRNNTANVLDSTKFDLGRDVEDPAPGSYLYQIGFGGRTTGNTFINQYYGAIAARVIDPSPTNPRGALEFQTADPENSFANKNTRFNIGWGVYTMDSTGFVYLNDPGYGGMNAAKLWINNNQVVDKDRNGFLATLNVSGEFTSSASVIKSASANVTSLIISNTSSGGANWSMQVPGSGVAGRTGNLEILREGTVPSMTFAKNGYVGVNTTNPSANLDVSGTLNVAGQIKSNSTIVASNSNNVTSLNIANTASGGAAWNIQVPGSGVSGRTGNLELLREGTAQGITLAKGGNAGVNTTNPGATLDVAGTLWGRLMPLSGPPTTADIPSGVWTGVKRSDDGSARICTNDSGTIKCVTMTIQ